MSATQRHSTVEGWELAKTDELVSRMIFVNWRF